MLNLLNGNSTVKPHTQARKLILRHRNLAYTNTLMILPIPLIEHILPGINFLKLKVSDTC